VSDPTKQDEKKAAADAEAAKLAQEKADAEAAAKAAKEKADADKKAAADAKAAKGEGHVFVKARVNMLAKDGTRLIAGEAVKLSKAEAKRLAEDARHKDDPFFEVAKA
jgi:hypothetical protein